MVRLPLVVKVPHAGDERSVSILLRPFDRLGLGLGSVQNMICMILHDEIGDGLTLLAALRPSLDKGDWHSERFSCSQAVLASSSLNKNPNHAVQFHRFDRP